MSMNETARALEALRARRDEGRQLADAAPEMLTALRMVIREFCDTDRLCGSERRAIAAAIAAVRKAVQS